MIFLILAFSTNFCPILSDLSGNTVWPQASVFHKKKLAKMTIIGIFNVDRLARNVSKWDFLIDFSTTVIFSGRETPKTPVWKIMHFCTIATKPTKGPLLMTYSISVGHEILMHEKTVTTSSRRVPHEDWWWTQFRLLTVTFSSSSRRLTSCVLDDSTCSLNCL